MDKNIFDNHTSISVGDAPKGMIPNALALLAPSVPGLSNWISVKSGEQITQRALLEATHEQLRTLLTKSVLDNVASLSALEAHLSNIAPNGEDRYKTIIDAYALSAAMRIARW